MVRSLGIAFLVGAQVASAALILRKSETRDDLFPTCPVQQKQEYSQDEGVTFYTEENGDKSAPQVVKLKKPYKYETPEVSKDQLAEAIKNKEKLICVFYAPWCPHCQHFALDYERVAQTLQQLEGSKRAVAATVDCVMFAKACEAWGIKAYPTLLWASKAVWLEDSPEKVAPVKLHEYTAERLASWISDHLDVSLSLVSKDEVVERYQNAFLQARQAQTHAATNFTQAAPVGRADTWDMQVSTALLLRSALDEEHGDDPEPDKQRDLRAFVRLLQQQFPEESCRSSLESVRQRLAADSIPAPDDLEKDWQLCGTPWEAYGRRSWRSCRGTVPGKRGFTCGLWSLLHSLAARSDDASAGENLDVMRNTIGSFFQCEDCREHFMGLPVSDADRGDRASAQMWWWRTHNLVNTRVGEIEADTGDGDAGFPKAQWPTPELCSACQRQPAALLGRGSSFLQVAAHMKPGSDEWDLVEVAAFLDRYYG